MPDTVKTLKLEIVLDETGAVKGVKGIGKATKGLKDEVEKTSKGMKGFTERIKKNWLGVTAVVTGAVLTIKKAFDFTKEFLEYQQGMTALSRNTGQNADKIVKKLKAVTKGTVANKDVMLAANRLVALNVTKDTDKMAKLFEIARLKAKAMGISTSQAISDISTGIGRASPLILDNLGIITKGWDKEAKAAGQAMDAQFILNKVLADGQVELNRTGASALTGAEKMQQLAAAWVDFRVRLGEVLTPFLMPMVSILKKIINFFAGLPKPIQKTAVALVALVAGFKALTVILGVMSLNPIMLALAGAGAAIIGIISLIRKGKEEAQDLQSELAKASEMAFSADQQRRIDRYNERLEEQKKLLVDLRNEQAELQNQTGRTAQESLKATSKNILKTEELIRSLALKIAELKNQIVETKKETEKPLKPIEVKFDSEEAETNVSDFFAFIDDQRQLDILKAEDAFSKSIEALDASIEEGLIKEEEGFIRLEELLQIHNENMALIEEAHLERMQTLDEISFTLFEKRYEDLTQKQKAETRKMLADWQKFEVTRAQLSEIFITGAIAGIEDFGSSFKDVIKSITRTFLDALVFQLVKFAIANAIINPAAAATATLAAGLLKASAGEIAKLREGGLLVGASHEQGGVNVEAEGGEYFVRKSSVTPDTIPILNAINSGVNNLGSLIPMRSFGNGGMVTNTDINQSRSQVITIGEVNIEDPDPDRIFNTILNKAEETGVDLLEGK